MAGHDLRREHDPVVAIDSPEQVANFAGGGLRQLDLVTRRVRLVAADQYVHLAVECRREQEDLAVAGSLVENASHCREESHVRHPIRLVDDGDGHVLKTYVAPVDEVLETARAGHQDVDGLTQGPQLRSVPRAAIDGGDGEASGPRKGTEHAADLSGQLARRHEHETSRTASLGARTAGEGFDDRDREREGLAGARRRPAAHVPTGERVRKRRLLDRERACYAVTLKQRDNISGHAEIGEGGGHQDSSQLEKEGQPEHRLEASPATAGNRSTDRTHAL